MSKITTDRAIASEIQQEKWVRITFEAPASLQKAVKLKAVQEDRSIKEVLRELMENYVKDNKK